MQQPASIYVDDQQSSNWLDQLKEFLAQLQREAILLALAGLFTVVIILMSSTGSLLITGQATWMALALVALMIAVWVLRNWSYLAAALVLLAGSLAAVLVIATWLKIEQAIFLLIIPVGLAILTISRPAGLLVAVACSILLLVPSPLLPEDTTLRIITLLGMWSTLGMLWLTLRPLFTTMSWAWSGYENNQKLLQQARDSQLQLNQTLEDLKDANLQLTRLNRQAHSLRLIAEEARIAKDRFVANVSHELRTPLHMIIGFCEMITQSPQTYGRDIPQTLLADLAVVLRNSQHLLSLIDDVLDLSKIEAGQMALTKERVAISEIIEAAIIAVRPLFDAKNLYLRADVPGNLPEICCDKTRIREVVLNLLSNAGRFTESGGVIVRAWLEGNSIIVSVEDTGPGISAEDQSKLFQPFQQLEGTARRRFGGTGLGLCISKNFVELHDGKMWVESNAGHGSTFYFQLPIDTSVPLEPSRTSRLIEGWEYKQRTRQSKAPAPILRPRVVVMEQGDSLQHLISRYLDGVEVVSTSDLEQAIAELHKVPSQALLINQPHSYEILNYLENTSALPYGVPAIACYVPGVEQAKEQFGVVNFLVKPVSRESLLTSLGQLGKKIETVLIVDDEPDALRLVGRMLAEGENSYRVLRASSGRQALEILQQEVVDVILLDLIMPEMNGYQLLAKINEDPRMRNISTILVTAQDPLSQPLTSQELTVTCQGGLNATQLLSCIELLTSALSLTGPVRGSMS